MFKASVLFLDLQNKDQQVARYLSPNTSAKGEQFFCFLSIMETRNQLWIQEELDDQNLAS